VGSKELWVSAYMKYVRECVRACVCVCVCVRARGEEMRGRRVRHRNLR